MTPSACYILFAAFICGYLATKLVQVAATRIGFLDKPNALIPQHVRPIAYGGGIGVAIATAIVIIGTWLVQNREPQLSPIVLRNMAIAIPCVAYAMLGMVDDLLKLHAKTKLMCQLLISIVAVMIGLSFPFTGIAMFDAGLSVFWMLLVVNAVNVTDVCDGLVGGISFFILITCALIEPSTAWLSLPLAGAILGFLVLNAPPARIFLGDAGSHLIGITLAGLLLQQGPKLSADVRLGRMCILAAPFLFEVALLVYIRRKKELVWWKGSSDHFSLRLQAAGLTRWQTDLTAFAATIVCCLTAVWLTDSSLLLRVGLFGALGLLAIACLRFLLRHEVRPANDAVSVNDHPLHILWIHQNLVTARQAGNARPIYILAGFAEQGWHVDVITTQGGYLQQDEEAIRNGVVIERDGNTIIHRLPVRNSAHSRTRSTISFFLQAFRYMRQLRAADVVYVSTPQPTQILLSVFAAVVAGAPLVIEVRDLWPVFLRRLRMINSRFTSAILAWLEALGCRLSARCIAVSPGFTDYLERIGVQRERLAVIPSGADAAIVSKADIDQRNIENFSTEQPFTVLYAGSLNDPYAIDTLLAAARGLESRSDIQWVFAGNGRSRLNVEAAAQRETNIRFIPAIPRDEVISLYQQADVGIVSLANEPTLSSVIPGKLIDYLAAGVPVISVVDGVHGEMVRQSRAGIVLKEPTAAALVEAISNLAAMPATQRSAMRSAGQEWVMTHLPASRLARSVSRIVRDAHNDAPRRLNGLVATWAAIDAAVDVITMRSYRASQGLTSPDAAMLAAQSLRDWLTDSNTTADMNTSAELRIPRLLSSLADVTLPPLEQSSGQGVDLCR